MGPMLRPNKYIGNLVGKHRRLRVQCEDPKESGGYCFFHARTYSTLNVDGRSSSSGHPEPLGHRLAVEDQVQRLVPVRVLHRPHEHAVDVELESRPCPSRARRRGSRRPAARGDPRMPPTCQCFFSVRRRETCRVMLYLCSKPLALPPISNTSISVPQPGVSSWLEPERAGPARVHRLRLDLVVAVAGAGLRVQGGARCSPCSRASRTSGGTFSFRIVRCSLPSETVTFLSLNRAGWRPFHHSMPTSTSFGRAPCPRTRRSSART